MDRKIVNQITLCAILAAINILLISLNLALSFFLLVILIACPLASSIISLKCDFKYILIYFISTLLICCIVDFQTSLFHLIPCLLCGLLLGFLIKIKVHGFYILLSISLLNVTLEILSFVIIKRLYNIDIFSIYQNILMLDYEQFKNIILTFLYLFSIIPILIIYYIVEGELPKLHFNINEDDNVFYQVSISSTIINILSIFFVFIFPSIGYLLTAISLLFNTYLLSYLYRGSPKYLKITYTLTYSIFILVFIFSGFIKEYGYHLIFNIFSLTSTINNVIFIIYTIIVKKEIEPSLFNTIEENDEY